MVARQTAVHVIVIYVGSQESGLLAWRLWTSMLQAGYPFESCL